MDFKDLMKKILKYNKNVDIDLLKSAYSFSYNIIKDLKRANGRPWIEHYLEVTYEVANLKLDDKTLVASLLHGIINKGASRNEIKNIFGLEILNILENIETMSEIKRNVRSKSISPENLRKVLLAASSDLRALLIKICDKICNLRDLEYLSNNERIRIATEAMEIYAPIAYRLGLGRMKAQMEDLSFKYLEPKKYNEIFNKVDKKRKEAQKIIIDVKSQIESKLFEENIGGEIETRIKHIYSIYKKFIDKSYDLDSMSDIIGFRIITSSIDDCYKILKIIHTGFRPIPNRFKDYIALPKPNGYQSLHTSVIDNQGRIFEVQIRTKEMNDVAEDGIAAHFTYKKFKQDNEFDKKLTWLKQIVENENGNNFNIKFFGDEIFLFTPKGKCIELPNGSTVLDFAYNIHTDLGEHCTGANVNGKFVSMKEVLKNGDVIDIITAKTQKPSRDWLKFSRTTKARVKIKHYLKEAGKLSSRSYYVEETIKKEVGENLLVVEGDKRSKLKLALCCKPIPGDKIIGIKSSSIRIIVHNLNCKDIKKAGKKVVKVNWLEKFKKPIEIIVEGNDRSGLFKEIINSVSKLDLVVNDAKVKSIGNELIKCNFIADLGNLDKLNETISRIKKIKDVTHVYVNIV